MKADEYANVQHGDGVKADVSQIRSSFNDLVIYNDQGQPYLDINRLVYKPKKTKHQKEKEKVSWYIPDYLFVILNFLALTFSTYFLLNGLTLVSWRNSMQTFEPPANCNDVDNHTEKICEKIVLHYGQVEEDCEEDCLNGYPFTIIRFYGFVDINAHGFAMLFLGLLYPVNVVFGINACFKGNRTWLIEHLLADVVFFILETLLVLVLSYTATCDERDIDIIKEYLQRKVGNYAQDIDDELVKKDTIDLDTIQTALTCCGIGNWTDFLPRSEWSETGELITRSVMTRYNLDKSVMVIPYSCCRQWWVRNIYCAHSAHLMAYPTVSKLQAHQFRQRISQWGCLPKMVRLCENMITMVGVGGQVACGIHFCLTIGRFICAYIRIQSINTLVRERKKIFKFKEHNNEPVEEDDDEFIFPSISTLFDYESLVAVANLNATATHPFYEIPAPPNEGDLAKMKSRKDLNKLISQTKNTNIENWLTAGRAFVEGNELSKDYTKKTEEEQPKPQGKQTELSPQPEDATMSYELRNRRGSTKLKESITQVKAEKDTDKLTALEALKLLQNAKGDLNG